MAECSELSDVQVGQGGETLTSFNSQMAKAKRRAIREMKKQHRQQRREYKQQLIESGVPPEQRQELLSEFDKECQAAVREFKKNFRKGKRQARRYL